MRSRPRPLTFSRFKGSVGSGSGGVETCPFVANCHKYFFSRDFHFNIDPAVLIGRRIRSLLNHRVVRVVVFFQERGIDLQVAVVHGVDQGFLERDAQTHTLDLIEPLIALPR